MIYLWSGVNGCIYLKYIEALELDVFALVSELKVVWGDVARHSGDLTIAHPGTHQIAPCQQLQYTEKYNISSCNTQTGSL